MYEQREPDPDFNDGYALGVVTAFCPSYDVCPPGVNVAYEKLSLKKYSPTAARNEDKKVCSGLL